MTLIANLSDALRGALKVFSSKRAANLELAQIINDCAGAIDATKTAPNGLRAAQYVEVDPGGNYSIPFYSLGDVTSARYIYLLVGTAGNSSSIQLRGDGGCSLQFASAVTDKNKVTVPANVAIAMSIWDGTNHLIDFVTTTGGLALDCKVPLRLSDSGIATASGTGGTSTVTLSKQNGVITTDAITTAAGAAHVITVTNTLVAATSRILVTLDKNGSAGTPVITSVTPGSGSFTVEISNLHASAAVNAALKVHFLVLP